MLEDGAEIGLVCSLILEAFFEKHLLVDWFNVFKESKIIEILDRNHFKNIQCISCSIEEDERIKTINEEVKRKSEAERRRAKARK